jgi:hypothetical protein
MRNGMRATKVWAVDGAEIPGLFCEADSFDELVEIVLDLAPDLLRANDAETIGQLVEIKIIAERHGNTRIAA